MRLPIRARLTLVSGVLMAAVLVALGAFLFLRVQAELLAAVDAGLRSRADVLLARIGEGGLVGGGALVEGDEAFAQLLDDEGRVLQSSDGLVDEPLVAPDGFEGQIVFERLVTTAEEVVPARLLAVTVAGSGTLVVGASLEDQQEALALLLGQLLIAGPVAVALASGVGWLVAGAALRPVERLRLEAEAISGAVHGRRLAVPGTGDELARLGESLNRMLGRLEEAVERERRFVGDASHELRTPLANLKAELELALRRARTPDQLVAALHSAAEETDRLTSLAEDLLVLARSEGGRLPVRREALDAARLVREIVAGFAGRATELGISIGTTGADYPQHAELDPARVRQALGNVIDNAVRHTPRGGRVTVDLRDESGSIAVEVTDTGAGFDAGFLQRAFEPFSRADEARSRSHGGAGLGLAIVRAVADAHGGSVVAANRPGGGASVVIQFPRGSA
ncbi:MAG: HAMP domain-containing protein [Chloroflexi bacterium]|nr:HAMP domain-containing protein [Chloroflexota bacterium]